MATKTRGIAFRRMGRGPTVVLLHGIPGRGSAWDRVRAALDQTVDVVIPDLIGFGDSDGPEKPTFATVGPAAQAGAVAAVLDDLGVRSATVVGHDFGAPVGTLLAAARPDLVNGLAVLSGNVFPDTPIPFPLSLTNAPALGGLFSRLLFCGPSLRLMVRQGNGPGTAPPDAAAYVGDPRQRRTIRTVFSGALSHLSDVYSPVAAALADIDVPIFVGWGDRDPFFPVEQAGRTAALADGRVRIFEGAGHFLPHERPVEVAREIIEFVAAVAE